MNSSGNVLKDSVSVNVTDIYQPVELRANATSGIANLTTYFDISSNIPNPVSSYTMNFGDGTLYNGSVFENVSHVYNSPGIYYPKITITDNAGYVFTDTIAVTLMSRAETDTLLKGKWDGMKAKLIGWDVEGALGYYSANSKAKYREIFTLIQAKLPEIAGNMQEIELIYVHDGQAKYRINRQKMYGGQLLDVTHYIYFSREDDGTWKIQKY